MAITPLVMSFVNNASEGTMVYISGGFRLLVAQLVFFVLTLVHKKLFKDVLKVDSVFGAWRAAWAPAILVVVLALIVHPFTSQVAIELPTPGSEPPDQSVQK